MAKQIFHDGFVTRESRLGGENAPPPIPSPSRGEGKGGGGKAIFNVINFIYLRLPFPFDGAGEDGDVTAA